MTTETPRPLNEAFVENVLRHSITFYDAMGSEVFHSTSLQHVADYLLATGERHYGPGLGGPRPSL